MCHGLFPPQIALVDLLTSMGLRPDGIVGHSLGEVACGYADGCLSQEEAVLSAYWRGQCIKEAHLPAGSMAAVGRWQLWVPPPGRGCSPGCLLAGREPRCLDTSVQQPLGTPEPLCLSYTLMEDLWAPGALNLAPLPPVPEARRFSGVTSHCHPAPHLHRPHNDTST